MEYRDDQGEWKPVEGLLISPPLAPCHRRCRRRKSPPGSRRAGDVDNDGRQDLYVANLGASLLYEDNGDGTFTDIAAEAGVRLDGWGTG